jgi:hypothetical protein
MPLTARSFQHHDRHVDGILDMEQEHPRTYLHPGVDLQKEVSPRFIHHELHCAGIDVSHVLGNLDCIRMQRSTDVGVQPICRRKLHHLRQGENMSRCSIQVSCLSFLCCTSAYRQLKVTMTATSD